MRGATSPAVHLLAIGLMVVFLAAGGVAGAQTDSTPATDAASKAAAKKAAAEEARVALAKRVGVTG